MPTIGPFPPSHRISTIMSSKPPKNAFLPPSPLSPPAHPNRWKRPMKGTGRAAVQSNPGGGRRPCSGGEEGRQKKTHGRAGIRGQAHLQFTIFVRSHTYHLNSTFSFSFFPTCFPSLLQSHESNKKRRSCREDDLQGGRIRREKTNQ